MRKGLKFYAGMVLFALSWLMPVLAMGMMSWTLPIAIKGPLIGLLTVGGPELGCVVAVALLGKETFELMNGKIFSLLKKVRPQAVVSKTRYVIGLVLFVVTLVPTYIMGYAPQLLPDASPSRLYVAISADVLFVISLFVLGGDFWDKLRALFIYEAKAQFPTQV